MKMSMPFGKCTITTTVSGRGNLGLEQLIIPVLLLVGAAVATSAYAHQIGLVLTVLSFVAFVAAISPFVYVSLRDITWPHQRRRIQAFSAQVDAAFAAQLEQSGPLHVTAERVRELEPAAPYVVDLEREAVPVELDALDR